jgi:hypothetical protein
MLGLFHRRPTPVQPLPAPTRADPLRAAYAGIMRRMFEVTAPRHDKLAYHGMLYVAQMHFMAVTGKPMFPNLFIATHKGPALVEVDAMTSAPGELDRTMHPIHATLEEGDFSRTLDEVVAKMAYMTDDDIRAFCGMVSGSTANCVVFRRWQKNVGVKNVHHHIPFKGAGMGAASISADDIADEIRSRYPHEKIHESLRPARMAIAG